MVDCWWWVKKNEDVYSEKFIVEAAGVEESMGVRTTMKRSRLRLETKRLLVLVLLSVTENYNLCN